MKHAARFLAIVEDARSRIEEISVDVLRKRVDAGDHPSVLVDVREESEWASGHIPSAIHLSKGTIERDIERTLPDTTSEIVLYCGGGYRSALAADTLRAMGYTKVSSLATGIRGWRESGGALEHESH